MSLLHNTTRPLRGLLQRSRPVSFSRLLMGAALLGGSGSALMAGSAQAALTTPCNFGPTAAAPLCSTASGDWYASTAATDKEVNFISFPALNGHTDFLSIPIPPGGYDGDIWQVMFSIDSPQAGQSGSFDYTIRVTDTDWQFKNVDLSINGAGDGSSVKYVYSTSAIGNPAFLIGTVTDTVSGASSGALDLTGYSQVWVRDTFTSTAGTVSNLQNNFMQQSSAPAPGPLPLLGAGAAFSFSRRLRSRLRSARAAA